MNELIKVVEQGNERLVNARDLYEKLGVKSRFNDWINNRIKDYGYIEGEDYFFEKLKNPKGQSLHEYQLTVETARELAIVENNEKGREIRKYLIERARAWNTPEMVIKRARQAGAIILTEKEVEELEFLAEGMAITPFPRCGIKGIPETVMRIWTKNEEGGRVYVLQTAERKLMRWIHIYDADGKHVRMAMARWSDKYGQWTDYEIIKNLEKQYLPVLGKWGKMAKVEFTDYFRWCASMVKSGKTRVLLEDKGDSAVAQIGVVETEDAEAESAAALPPFLKRDAVAYIDDDDDEPVFFGKDEDDVDGDEVSAMA